MRVRDIIYLVYSKGVIIQARDIALLRGLFESRVMTIAQVAAIYFENKYEAAKKRVHKLVAINFLGQLPRHPSLPAFLCLTQKAFCWLLDKGFLHDYPHVTVQQFEKRIRVSKLTLNHELAVLDCKAAITAAIRKQPTLSLVDFSTWPTLYQFNTFHPATRIRVLVKPDAFLKVQEAGVGDHLLFLEVDKSTESQNIIVDKMLAYRSFYQQGGMAVRLGLTAAAYRSTPFRVLLICESKQRYINLARSLLLLYPPIKTMAWFSTREEILSDPLGAIWVRPVDYKNAIARTNFEVSAHRQPGMYHRRMERETRLDTLLLYKQKLRFHNYLF